MTQMPRSTDRISSNRQMAGKLLSGQRTNAGSLMAILPAAGLLVTSF